MELFFCFFKKNLEDCQHKHLGIMYEKAEKYPWRLMTQYSLPSIKKNTAISKGRHFILADESLWPTKGGKNVKVACWLPSGVNQVGYCYTNTFTTQFLKTVALFSNQGKLERGNFWMNKFGVYETSGDGAAYYLHLIRLMYLIGYDKDTNGNTLNPAYTLPTDSIAPQLNYYKNHILKCYDTK